MSGGAGSVKLTFIHKHPPCKKCLKAKAVLDEAMAEAGVDVEYNEVIAGTPEAAAYGAVFSPMVVIEETVASAGYVPLKSGLIKLLKTSADGK